MNTGVLSRKKLADFFGTSTLVLFGCDAAVIAGGDIGLVGISFAFGLALIGMAYSIGLVSGCHINPAVTLGVMAAGRMPAGDAVDYIIARVLGGILCAGVLRMIASGKVDYGVAANVLGRGYLGEYTTAAALIFKIASTFLFVVVILGVTGPDASAAIAGLAIGLALVVIHLMGINVTGVSMNPTHSVGLAVFVSGTAFSLLWLFIVAPIIGAVATGLLFPSGQLSDLSQIAGRFFHYALRSLGHLRRVLATLQQRPDEHDQSACSSKHRDRPREVIAHHDRDQGPDDRRAIG